MLETGPDDGTEARPCPSCGRWVSIHASLCRYCWSNIDPDAPASGPHHSRQRKASLVALVSAGFVLMFFVVFRFVVVRNVQAERALASASTSPGAPVPAGSGASPAVASVDPGDGVTVSPSSSPSAAPTRKPRQRHGPIDPAEAAEQGEHESILESNLSQLQTLYIAIACSGIALVCAVVAFARAWR